MAKSTSPASPLTANQLKELEAQKSFVNKKLEEYKGGAYKEDYMNYSERAMSALKASGHYAALPAGVSAASLGVIFSLFAVVFQIGLATVCEKKLTAKDLDNNLFFGLANSFVGRMIETGNFSFESIFNKGSEFFSGVNFDFVDTALPADLITKKVNSAKKLQESTREAADDITGGERFTTQTQEQNRPH